MTVGRKPTPTALKLIQGNPGKRALPKAEPKPRPVRPDCPAFLNKAARAIWDDLADDLDAMGVLTIVDACTLAGFCSAYEEAQRLGRFLDAKGITVETPSGYLQQRPEVSVRNKAWDRVAKFGAELGIGAASRARISIEKPNEGETPLAGILEETNRAKSRAQR